MIYKYNIALSFDVTSDVCYKTIIPWLSMLYYIYNAKNRNLVVKLHRATRLLLVALNKSLTMIITSFLCVINVI